jgi:hypothetical protein
MKLRLPRLTQSVRLQLHFIAGMLLVSPLVWLGFQLPILRQLPQWFPFVMLGVCYVGGLIWFRQCMSADKQSFKAKWW